ncbi:DUF2219 domain-containing protein [Phenylobacterium sp.]|jgi:hypothetical protein|uniref:DUF2219 domain-containing protein n=1 Tax=Phenylobacterium sp. TaxID=1871053 RepID=UPI002F93C7A1
MRVLAGLATIALCAGASGAAAAESLAARSLADAAFAASAVRPDADLARLMDRDRTSSQVTVSERAGGPVDSVRLSTDGFTAPPGGLPINLERPEFAGRDYELSVIRNWPRALSFDTGRFDIGLSPHAGVGVGNRGGSAEAGAEIRLQSKDDRAAKGLKSLGVKDGSMFGDQGRWYLFAAAGARAVGLNMLKGEGGWDRAGWTTDPAAAVVGDAHVGVGYRKGPLQTSFGVIHREVKGQHMVFGQETKEDTVAAFTLSIKPRLGH